MTARHARTRRPFPWLMVAAIVGLTVGLVVAS
jgi:tetrahydromethanopterin S-methyltransferase subunit E